MGACGQESIHHEEEDMSESNKRIWKFLADNVILRDSHIKNRHQAFLQNMTVLN